MKILKNILIPLGIIVIIALAGVGVSKIAGVSNDTDFTVDFFKEAYIAVDNSVMHNNYGNVVLTKVEGKFNVPVTSLPVFEALKVESYIAIFQDSKNIYYLTRDIATDSVIVSIEPQMVEMLPIEAFLGDYYGFDKAAKKIYRNRRKLTDNGIFTIENIDGEVVYKFGETKVNRTGKIVK